MTQRRAVRMAFGGSRRKIALRPRGEKTWLLAGTALATLVMLGSGVGPASAACSVVDGGIGNNDAIVCTGNADGSGGAHEFVAPGDFDADVDVSNTGATYLYNDDLGGGPDAPEALHIDTRDAEGLSIDIDFGDNVAIRSANSTGLAAESGGNEDASGDIDIDSAAVIEAAGNGIYADSYGPNGGNVTVTNRGVIGVQFRDGLTVDGNQFEVDDTVVTLQDDDQVENGAYTIGSGVGGNGIYAASGDTTNNEGGGNVTVTNFGTIHAQNSGIYAQAAEGTVTVANLSTDSIYSDNHGIEAVGGGGTVTVFNGDNSDNEDPIEDNPDGAIHAAQDGIHATNENGGDINVVNGLKYNSNSTIFAGGEYGIYARSSADNGEDGDGQVQAWNLGYVETYGDDAEAGIHARTSADNDGFAGIYNGVIFGDDVDALAKTEGAGSIISPNARVNAYDLDINGDEVETDWADANGLEVIKFGGEDLEAGKRIASDELLGYIGALIGVDGLEGAPGLSENPLSLNFTAFAYNYGTWDFEGADDYLTPGFDQFGNLVEKGSEAATVGGVFAPGGSAFVARNYSNGSTGLFNYGTMIGQGNRFDPVISINTEHYSDGSGSLGGELSTVTGVPNFVFLYNAGYQEHTITLPLPDDAEPDAVPTTETFATYGVIGSTATPSSWDFSAEEAFATKFGMMAGGGVNWDFVDGMLDGAQEGASQLGEFAEAAGDQLLRTNSDGAGVLAFNQGLLIGQVDIGADNDSLGLMINDGSWFTHGTSNFYGSDSDILLNTGLVQAAFRGDLAGTTRFNSLNYTANFGVISLMDGGFEFNDGNYSEGEDINEVDGDRLVIDGDYIGGPGFEGSIASLMSGEQFTLDEPVDEPTLTDDPKLGNKGYFALDTFFAGEETGLAASDVIDVRGALAGSTGIIVRNDEHASAYRGINLRGTDAVEYGYLAGGDCGDDGVCTEGDAVYISSLSPNYFQVDGVGAIADGVFATYLVHDDQYEDFEWRTTWGPGATNAPALVTGAQHIFYDTLSVVDDHSYGYQFSEAGGAGADLPAAAPVYDAPAASAAGSQYGLWAKGSGSWTDFDGTTNNNGVLDGSSEGSQDTYSILGGADMKWDPNSPFRFGLFGGYVTSDLDFDNGGSADYEGGTAGAYLAYNDGAFYVDGTVKGDWLSTDYSFANLDVDADVTNVGVSANTGYRFTMGRGYIEPIASVAYVHTSVDDIDDQAASIDFSESDSLRAGAGARIGTAFATVGGTKTDLSLLGKVWNEFEDANEVTVDDGQGNTSTFSDDISGVFGEVNAVATVTSADGLLSGFVSAGGQFGDNFTSYNAKAGIRKGF